MCALQPGLRRSLGLVRSSRAKPRINSSLSRTVRLSRPATLLRTRFCPFHRTVCFVRWSFGGKITLLSGMRPAEEFLTLVHEIAHEMLHHGERRTLTQRKCARPKPRPLLWSSASPSDLISEPPPPTISNSGMGTRNSCKRA